MQVGDEGLSIVPIHTNLDKKLINNTKQLIDFDLYFSNNQPYEERLYNSLISNIDFEFVFIFLILR